MFRPSFTPTARGAMPNLNCQKAQHDDDNADVDGDANDGHDNDDVDNDRVVLIIMAIMIFIAIICHNDDHVEHTHHFDPGYMHIVMVRIADEC